MAVIEATEEPREEESASCNSKSTKGGVDDLSGVKTCEHTCNGDITMEKPVSVESNANETLGSVGNEKQNAKAVAPNNDNEVVEVPSDSGQANGEHSEQEHCADNVPKLSKEKKPAEKKSHTPTSRVAGKKSDLSITMVEDPALTNGNEDIENDQKKPRSVHHINERNNNP